MLNPTSELTFLYGETLNMGNSQYCHSVSLTFKGVTQEPTWMDVIDWLAG